MRIAESLTSSWIECILPALVAQRFGSVSDRKSAAQFVICIFGRDICEIISIMLRRLISVSLNLIRRIRRGSYFVGPYKCWEDAVIASAGYSQPEILSSVLKAVLQVKAGKAKWERDSVLFHAPEYRFNLLALLLRSALENSGKITVLDFGGSLGSSYFQNRTFIPDSVSIEWNIIEQPSFVEAGKMHIETEELKFFSSLQEAQANRGSSILILSSSLQYIEDPITFLRETLSYNFQYVFIDLTPIVVSGRERIFVQHVSPLIYQASYPMRTFTRSSLLSIFTSRYSLEYEAPSDRFTALEDFTSAHYKVMIFKLNPSDSKK